MSVVYARFVGGGYHEEVLQKSSRIRHAASDASAVLLDTHYCHYNYTLSTIQFRSICFNVYVMSIFLLTPCLDKDTCMFYVQAGLS